MTLVSDHMLIKKKKKKKANPNYKRGQNPTITNSVSTSWLHHDRCPHWLNIFLEKKNSEKKETFLLSNVKEINVSFKKNGNFKAAVFALVVFEQFQLLILLSLSIFNYIPTNFIHHLSFRTNFPRKYFPLYSILIKTKTKTNLVSENRKT